MSPADAEQFHAAKVPRALPQAASPTLQPHSAVHSLLQAPLSPPQARPAQTAPTLAAQRDLQPAACFPLPPLLLLPPLSHVHFSHLKLAAPRLSLPLATDSARSGRPSTPAPTLPVHSGSPDAYGSRQSFRAPPRVALLQRHQYFVPSPAATPRSVPSAPASQSRAFPVAPLLRPVHATRVSCRAAQPHQAV